MKNLERYRLIREPSKSPDGKVTNKYICVDPNGIPFRFGTDFIPWCIYEYLGVTEDTAVNYVNHTCEFLTHLHFHNGNFLASTREIRKLADDYLEKKLNADIRPHQDKYKVIYPRSKDNQSEISIRTAKLAIQGMKWFYDYLIIIGVYKDENPFGYRKGILRIGKGSNPGIPPKSGASLPIKHKRMPELYYRFKEGEWEPFDINDPTLKQIIVPKFKEQGDYIIARILFEGGPRISEILALNIGDWRALHSLRPGAKTINKGSNGIKIKDVYWFPETDPMIFNYCNTLRKKFDLENRDLLQLPDDAPLFINSRGNRQTYDDYYYEWKKVCNKLNLQITPHQIRHWYVTSVLDIIDKLPEDNLISRSKLRTAFINYMHWDNVHTIDAYDHVLKKREVQSAYDIWSRQMEKSILVEDKENQKVSEITQLISKPEEDLIISNLKRMILEGINDK
jgi:integrase